MKRPWQIHGPGIYLFAATVFFAAGAGLFAATSFFAAGLAFPTALFGALVATSGGKASAAASSSSQAAFMHSVKKPGSGSMVRQDTTDTHITPL